MAVFISIIACILGTGLGGAVAAFFGSKADKALGVILSLAGGFITSLVFFELMPESLQYGGIALFCAGAGSGIIALLLLNRITSLRSGAMMILAIGLHNVITGFVIGATAGSDAALGVTLAFLIGIHNIPEGMAVSALFMSGGLNKLKSVALALLAGAPIAFGAVIGSYAGSITGSALSVSLSIAGGAMLYVVFGEMLPQAMNLRKRLFPTVIFLSGVMLGLLLIKSHVLLEIV